MIGALTVALCAIGNRCWGSKEGSHWLGLVIMSLGIFISIPVLWAIPFYAALVFIWRSKSPRPWMAVGHGYGWRAGMIRGMLVLPLAVLLAIVDNEPLRLLYGFVAVFAVPAAYWLGFKYTKAKGELSELLAGAVVGLLAAV